MPDTIHEDIQAEAMRIIQAGAAQNIVLRLLGGMAIRIHSPSASHRALARSYPDIDLATPLRRAQPVETLFTALGYQPNKTFNLLNGDSRLLFYDHDHSRQVDVFVGGFQMCHRLPITERLSLEPLTVPLAELFLTKAQIVELNRKDALDLLALLLDHPVDAEDAETINVNFISDLCAGNWGLYTTVTMNLQKLDDLLEQGRVELDAAQSEIIKARQKTLVHTMESAPKTLQWKMRAKVGKRLSWYEQVEEVQRT